MYRVEFAPVAGKLRKLPSFIVAKLQRWAEIVELLGLPEVRKIPGFHDEPLKGNRHGQRSIRLNRAYRAFYLESKAGEFTIVEIIEVNKHEY